MLFIKRSWSDSLRDQYISTIHSCEFRGLTVNQDCPHKWEVVTIFLFLPRTLLSQILHCFPALSFFVFFLAPHHQIFSLTLSHPHHTLSSYPSIYHFSFTTSPFLTQRLLDAWHNIRRPPSYAKIFPVFLL